MSQSEGQLRAVLIGIDAYRTRPLTGCVNDLDAVEQLLLERARVPAENVSRLASARAPRPTRLREAPATLANIRAALAALAAQVQEGDDVLFYYSGHGVRVPFTAGGYTLHREALVPIDGEDASAERLLYDHELNGALARLAAVARSVTCVLDCCHAAGATRGHGSAAQRARALDPVQDLRWRPAPLPAAPAPPRGGAAPAPSAEPWPASCLVVAACLHFELAVEEPDRDGRYHGLLTRAWLRALDGIADAELGTARWSQIWQAMRAEVETRNAQQHIWMSGSQARRILGGPPAGGDAGLPLQRRGAAYEIGAGELESVTAGAVVAVYGSEPDWFPPPGAAEDLAARAGLLRVTAARADLASAVPIGAPFELPPGARGRVVEAGRGARLRCALEPHDGALAAAIQSSPLLELADPASARARLIRTRRGWLLADEAYEGTWSTALGLLPGPHPELARAALEHCYQYSLPLRLGEAARDLPDVLDLRVLACARTLSPAAAQAATLDEAPTRDRGEYELAEGAGVCLRVHNRSRERLRVAILNVAASGRVQLLGEEPLEGHSARMIWGPPQLGAPFTARLPPGRRVGIDRLVAIGTTDLSRDLGYLQVSRRFSDILELTRGAPTPPAASAPRSASLEQDPKDLLFRPPGSRWTATRATVWTYMAPEQRAALDRDDAVE